jgi:hypothetical protein
MSIERVAQVLAADWPDTVTPTHRIILVGIANHDGDGGAWPARATLARYAGISERSVKRNLHQLADLGVLEIDRNAGGTATTRPDRRPNLYRIIFPVRGDADVPSHGLRGDADGMHGGTPVTERGDAGGHYGGTCASPEPSCNRPEPSVEPSVAFDTFWQAWPNKAGKHAASKRWERMTDTERTAAIAGVAYFQSIAERDGNTRYIPHGSTYLNQRRWEDEPTVIHHDTRPDTRSGRNLAAIGRFLDRQQTGEQTRALGEGRRL